MTTERPLIDKPLACEGLASASRWVLSLASAAAAVTIAEVLVEPLDGVYYALPVAVLSLSAVKTGPVPALVSTALATLGVGALLVAPSGPPSQSELLQLAAFFVTASVVSVVSGSLRGARAREARERLSAARAAEQAERRAVEARDMLEALRTNEIKYKQLADSMPQIVWTVEADGTPIYYNRRWYELSGIPEGHVSEADWLNVLHPDDRQRCVDTWHESLRTGKPFQVEYRFRFTATGQYRWYLGRALAGRDEAGRVVQWYGTSTDIHDAKRAEEALRASEERHRVLAEALRVAARRKDEFLAMLSHELRNPLAPLKSSLYILARVAPDNAQARRAVEVIERQVGHLTRLIDDLLDVTRIARKKIQLHRTAVELNELVRRSVEDHQRVFERMQVELAFIPAAQPVWVDGDPTRLSQVVGNLLQNAAKFTDAGGTATIAVEHTDRSAQIRVRDNGVGIEPKILPHMFEPFTQAESTLDRSRGGLGLGLALVKGLVELHGGEVEARSEGLRHGSEFTVRLPEAPMPPAAAETAGESAPAASARVLVVEDNLDAAESLKEVLELSELEVFLAHSGPEGLEKARALRPDIVICDVGLPGMDGYEVARAIRADPRQGSTPLVALTGYASPEDRQRARDAGFDRHLSKPPDLDALLEMIHELVAHARA